MRIGDKAPEALRPQSLRDLERRWRHTDDPLVSVLCPTYNHAEFIESALCGFLGQETSFAFEVLVRDDASTDGTAEIIREWSDRYPGIIRPVLETRNKFHEARPLSLLTPMARGLFLAICEGDDYWIDSAKIQRQVESLIAQPSAIVSHHQSVSVADGLVTSTAKLPPELCRDFEATELQHGAWILTNSLLYWNVHLPDSPYENRIINGDAFLRSRLGAHGKAIYEEDFPAAVYRIHSGGIWSSKGHPERAITHSQSFFWIAKHYADCSEHALATFWLTKSAKAIEMSLLESGVFVRPWSISEFVTFFKTRLRARFPRLASEIRRIARRGSSRSQRS